MPTSQPPASAFNINAAARNVYNLKASNLKWSRKAIARMREGEQRFRIGFIGASDTSGTNDTSVAAKAVPAVLAKILSDRGFATRADGLFLSQPIGGINDARVSIGAGWGQFYPHLVSNATTTNAYTFLPTGNVTRFEVWYFDFPGATFSYAIDGGSTTNVVCAGTNQYLKLTVNAGSTGAHTLSLRRVSGTVFLSAIEAYDSAVFDAGVLNFGVGGSLLSDWSVSSNDGPRKIARASACDLYFINLGPNDMNNGIPLATSMANYRTLINDLKTLNADVVLVAPHVTSTVASLTTQMAFQTSLKALAIDLDLPLACLADRWVSFAAADALGMMEGDHLHPSKYGYRDTAAFYASTVFDLLAA